MTFCTDPFAEMLCSWGVSAPQKYRANLLKRSFWGDGPREMEDRGVSSVFQVFLKEYNAFVGGLRKLSAPIDFSRYFIIAELLYAC